jgi:hypothetical protein
MRDVAPEKINRAICYCDDCQAFVHYLGRAELLDAHGGTDIVQGPPNKVTFDRGAEHIAGMRLRPKGLYRWYASCCKTPLGNTVKPSLPFVGLVTEVFRGAPDAKSRDDVFGKPRAAVKGQYAIGGAPEGSTKFPWGMMAHIARLLLGWKLGGKAWPHPFFDRATGKPNRPMTVLKPEEREALRAHCGPNPSIASSTTR